MAQAKLQQVSLVGAPGIKHAVGVEINRIRLQGRVHQRLSGSVYQHKAHLRVELQPEVEQPGAAGVGPATERLLPVGQKQVASGLFPGFARLNGFCNLGRCDGQTGDRATGPCPPTLWAVVAADPP